MSRNDDDDLLGFPEPSNDNDDSPLRRLLMKACPPHPRTGQKSVKYLASLLTSPEKPDGLVDEAIYRWIRAGRIPPIQASRVVDVSKGRVTLTEFSPFIYFENHDG